MTELLLAMDFMVGTADQPYAATASANAIIAIEGARANGIPVVYTKVGFRPGHPEISQNNKLFATLLGTDKLVGAGSALADPFAPTENEPVVDKKRFSAFAGSGLWTIVRASGAASIVLCGLSTSGVVLSTAMALIDADFDVTVLSDACADPETEANDVILKTILAKRAHVRTVADWTASLAAKGALK